MIVPRLLLLIAARSACQLLTNVGTPPRMPPIGSKQSKKSSKKKRRRSDSSGSRSSGSDSSSSDGSRSISSSDSDTDSGGGRGGKAAKTSDGPIKLSEYLHGP